MIKESIIFEGTAGDNITDAITVATSKAKELNKDVFIHWNGATVRVKEEDNKNSILKNYHKELAKIGLYIKQQNGELISKNELAEKIASIITNFLNNN